MESSNVNACKVFVGNVPFQCTKEEFIECFKKYDGFIDGDIVNRYNSDNCRGFGFITFTNIDFAKKFLENHEQLVLKSRTLRFSEYAFDEKKQVDTAGKKYLFVKNLPEAMTHSELRGIFEKHGKVGTCFINTNNITGESKGSGVVEIVDTVLFNKMLLDKEIIHGTHNLSITRWRQKVKVKKPKKVGNDAKDIYRLAFNAGRNMGLLEGIKITNQKKV